MENFRNILVPVDFSTCSRNALQYSILLSKMLQARIFLIHVYEYPVSTAEMSYAGNDDFYKEIEVDAHIDMEVLERKLLYETGVEYYSIFKPGPTVETICQSLQQYQIDLVVMGTTGKTSLEKVLFGGNTVSLIGKINIPVLVVPESTVIAEVNNLVLAYDFVCYPDKSMLQPLLAIANAANATIHILHVAQTNDNVNEEESEDDGSWISSCLENVKHVYHFVEGHDIEKKIWQYTHDYKADLLVLKPRMHRSLMDRLFSSSMTRKMVYHPHLPILILQ